MPELSNAELEILSRRIVTSIQDTQLQLELIDHCCCGVEELMSEGYCFDDALDQALYKLEPDGIHAIEAAVQHVLKPKTLQAMKIILFLSGFAAAFCLMLGVLFRVMHWPGANVLLLMGDFSLAISMFMLVASSISAPRAVSGLSLVRTITGAAGGLILGVGSVFKIMHWPGASVLVVVGMVLVTFVFLPIFFWQLYQREMKSIV